jgi:O-acetyl-ADP-ribose deacetylase (regulator of RNase III)
MKINYLVGDATAPIGQGPKIIVHICNDIGGWGRGFVVAISNRWPQPEKRYRAWRRGEEKSAFALGEVQFVQVEDDTWIANMIAQRDVRTINGIPPIRYDALRKALQRVAEEALARNASTHMPRIGCGLAGGTWDEVEQIVEQELIDKGVPVTVYDPSASK